MDKLQAWLDRIRQAPRREVANLDHWALLLEARVAAGPIRWAGSGDGKGPADGTGRPEKGAPRDGAR